MPALPLDEAGKYVAGAYVVFFTLIVVYVSIMAAKVARIDRELSELVEIAEERKAEADEAAARDEEPVA
jgi:CcmD family protein